MAFESGSTSQLLRIAEVTNGTTPVTPQGTFTRYTACSLDHVKDTFESKEIRQDRQTSDLRHGILTGAGDLDFELSAAAFDDIIEAALGGTWATNVVKIGNAKKSFTMELGHTGIAVFKPFRGVFVDKFGLDFKAGEIVTGKASLMTMSSAAAAGTTLFSTTAAAPTNSPMDTFSGTMLEGGGASAILTALSLNLDNGIEQVKVMGQNTLAGVAFGRARVSGTLSAYFDSATLLNKFINETESSISVQASNGAKSLTFLLTRIKYTGSKSGVNREGLLGVDLPFTALAPTSGTATTLQVTRVP